MIHLIRLGGVLNALLAIFHILFWKMLNWPESLSSLNSDQQAIMQVLNIHLILIISFFGFVSILYPASLLKSKMGKMVLVLIALFYLLRLVNEVIFWDISQVVSIVILLICAFVAGIYILGIKHGANVKTV